MAKAKIKKNLNQIIKKAMHRPISSDGFVLYPHIPGYNGSELGETQAEQSEIFKNTSVNNYNSPTNIRKVFITGSKVIVQYYSALVSKGAQTTPKWHVTEFPSDDNLFKVANEIFTYGRRYNEYMGEKSINANAKEPDNYTVEGNGIGVIANPWVCNNIEEIYFDWTMLISSDVAPYFSNICTPEMYTSFITKSTQAQETASSQIIDFFSAFNSGGIKDLRKRYPRLRLIAMISNLEDVLGHPSMVKVDQSFSDLEAAKQTWYEVNRELIGASGSLVLLGDLRNGLPKLNKEFIIKDNTYKFDYEKLKGEIERYTRKIDDYTRQQMYGTSSEEETTEQDTAVGEMTELEALLVDIETRYDSATANKVLQFAVAGSKLSSQDLKRVFMEMTKKNRSRFASVINLKLD